MASEKELKQAKMAYKSLCAMLDDKGWHYEKFDDKFSISCSAQGEDLPMKIRIMVDPERLLVILLSELPFPIAESRRNALAVAVSQANFCMVDGSFDYNYGDGSIVFRITACYRDSLISKELLEYMLMCACATIDDYNDKFLMVAKNNMTIEEIVEFIK